MTKHVPTLLIDGCNMGLRLVFTAGRAQLLPSHGPLALRHKAHSDMLPYLVQLASGSRGSRIHVVLDGKASGGSLAGTDVCIDHLVRLSVTALNETADEHIAAECRRISLLGAGESSASEAKKSDGALGEAPRALALAMGLGPVFEPPLAGAGVESSKPPEHWVKLSLRRAAGGRAPSDAHAPYGLRSRTVRSILLRSGIPSHKCFALRCLAAATGEVGEGEGEGAARGVREPRLIEIVRVAGSPLLVLTRDAELGARCSALGALSARSLTDLCDWAALTGRPTGPEAMRPAVPGRIRSMERAAAA